YAVDLVVHQTSEEPEKGRHMDGPEAMAPERRGSGARPRMAPGIVPGTGRSRVAADAGGDGIAGRPRHASGPGGSGRPRRARIDDEGADDHQGEQDVADL